MQYLVINLGSFHIALNVMRVIGQHMFKSGLQEVLSEAVSSGKTQQVISCRSYNRTVRAHKLTFEALMRVMWPLLQHWADEHDRLLICRRNIAIFIRNLSMDILLFKNLMVHTINHLLTKHCNI